MKVSKDNMWADNRRILPRRTTGVNKRLLKAIEESGMSNGQIAAAAETTISVVSAYLHYKLPYFRAHGRTSTFWSSPFRKICEVLAVCPDYIAGLDIRKEIVDDNACTTELNDNSFVNVLLTLASLSKKGNRPLFKKWTLKVVRMFFIEGYTINEIANETNLTPNYISFIIRTAIKRLRALIDKYGLTMEDFLDGTAEIKFCDLKRNEDKKSGQCKRLTRFDICTKSIIENLKARFGKDYELNKKIELEKSGDKYNYDFKCTKENFIFFSGKHFIVVTNAGNVVIGRCFLAPYDRDELKNCVVSAYKRDDGTLMCSYIKKAS